jgi:hypothetical protein
MSTGWQHGTYKPVDKWTQAVSFMHYINNMWGRHYYVSSIFFLAILLSSSTVFVLVAADKGVGHPGMY